MPAIHQGGTVLVTGASGGVGSHIVRGLARAGFKVRAAVRDPEQGEYVKGLADGVEYTVVEDMTLPNAYDKAVEGVDAVVHASSKPDNNNPGDPELVIRPAVQGVERLLEAIGPASPVQRVVLISSSAAVSISAGIHDEKEWNQEVVDVCRNTGAGAPPPYKYHASKVISEEAFWQHFKTPRSYDGVALLPAYVFGPPLEYSTSKGEITSSTAVLIPWVSGQMKDAPLETPFFPQVDAGDVATAAARALTKPAASGERFILCSGPTFNNDLAIAVGSGNTDSAFRASLKTESGYDCSKAENVLDMVWKDKDTSLRETVKGIEKVLNK